MHFGGGGKSWKEKKNLPVKYFLSADCFPSFKCCMFYFGIMVLQLQLPWLVLSLCLTHLKLHKLHFF